MSPTTPLGLVYCILASDQGVVVHTVRAQVYLHEALARFAHFLNKCVDTLSEWGERPCPALPRPEISMLIHTLTMMGQCTVLQHPTIQRANDGTLPMLLDMP